MQKRKSPKHNDPLIHGFLQNALGDIPSWQMQK